MMLRNLDLIITLSAILLNISTLLIPGVPTWLETLVALPLVFLLPGYIATEILFHRRKIAALHHLSLTLGLSIVIVIIGGLLLNLFAPGLQRITWLSYLSIFIVVGILIVIMQRRIIARREIKLTFIRSYEYLLFSVALGGIIFALWYAQAGVERQPHPGFTQFWLLPAAGNSCAVRLGMHSYESGPLAYRISVTANDTALPAQFPSVLKAGEQVERTIGLPSSVEGSTINVSAQLYRLDQPGGIYRSVNLLINRQGAYCTES